MLVTLPHDFILLDAMSGLTTCVRGGIRELEEIPNPGGFKNPWWVLKGTMIGAAKEYWLAALNNVKPVTAQT